MTRYLFHRLIADPGTGDPVCSCGWQATPSATVRTIHQAAARVRRHAHARNLLDTRPVVYRVRGVHLEPFGLAWYDVIDPAGQVAYTSPSFVAATFTAHAAARRTLAARTNLERGTDDQAPTSR